MKKHSTDTRPEPESDADLLGQLQQMRKKLEVEAQIRQALPLAFVVPASESIEPADLSYTGGTATTTAS